MRHINVFPAFTYAERDDLRKKIVHGVIESHLAAVETDRAHFIKETLAGKDWVAYPCWLSASKWTDGRGFKKFKFKGHSLYIHRASHEVFNGPVDLDQVVDHLCRVRGCCQPLHLEAVPPKENILRGSNQNHLLRNGAPPPVTAKDINPRFLEVPTIPEIAEDYWRRKNEGRDISRHWEEGNGPPPAPPDGFRWDPVRRFDSVTHVLNPIRDNTPIAVPVYPMVDEEVLRRCDPKSGAATPLDLHDNKLSPVKPESGLRRTWARIIAWLNGEVWL